jgi:hypothetical protein
MIPLSLTMAVPMPTRIDPDKVMTPGERQAKLLAETRKAGGDKVAVLLDAEGLGHLNTIIAEEGFETRQGRSEAIRFSLAKTAKGYARKKAKPAVKKGKA